jgi:hypothetical protein
MPINESNVAIHNYPVSRAGVNLHKNIVELAPEECISAQNCVWDNGMVKRGGQSLFSTTEVVASSKILGVHKFYKSDNTSHVLAASGTAVKYYAGANVWTSLGLTQTTGLNTYFTTWGALNRVYITNGTDKMAYWNGREFSKVCTITIATPAVISCTTHGFVAGDAVTFTTTGALPTGLSTGTLYYIISAGLTADAFEVSTTRGGSAVNTSGTQSGTHTAINAAGQVTIADGVPVMALPYQDRLLTILPNGVLTWSGSFSDADATWETNANCGVRPDTRLYGMTYHSVTSSSAGYEAKILLAGANGMYLFSATDLRPPYTTGDYTVYPLSIAVGCNAPRTMVWTPKGTIWLGIDRQVYILPFNSVTPVPVGTKIQSRLTDAEGIEKLPVSYISQASAVYHNGYYILSVAQEGQTTNTSQWWLDINRLYQDGDGHYGPWYGPMLGQTISCFWSLTGSGDGGELIGGEHTAKGYIYNLAKRDTFSDYSPSASAATTILVKWQTYYNPLGNPVLRKDVHKCEFEMLQVLGVTNVGFYDIDIALKTGDAFELNSAVIYWNDLYWDEFYWTNSHPIRQVVDISPAIHPRRLSVQVTHSSSADTFEIYSLNVAAVEQSQVFE